MKLIMKKTLNPCAWDDLTAAQRRQMMKVEQAKEDSGLRRYPSTCSAVFNRIPDDWWGKYSAAHIGEVAALLKAAYDSGKVAGLASRD